ncbi:CDGSH iron-sulfur domain-containing protein 3, mitochondrial [Neopsephotus bourkii]|uniref:CDGSH iron-sulfur domain-containing protein 3, mitochondrial n=1 Tax=Neopsephotus bourkii TaxID=309878 RepID=UPI002AA55A44|nr:CDGSH iron-sulfur domain-containing protein 3, mitochondrial [Neopsephotus bourkii]
MGRHQQARTALLMMGNRPGAAAPQGPRRNLPPSPPRLFRRHREEEEPLRMEVTGAMRLLTLVRAAEGGLRRYRDPFRIRSVRRSSGSPQAVIAAKEPFAVELKAGRTYAWCSCGHSKRQPFCDGAHKTAAPGLSPLRFTPEEDARVRLCGCKRTRTPPYCDGTHKGEEVQGASLPPRP